MQNDKLTREDWLDLALETLRSDGYSQLKAQSLAKTLNVTRGSFYYHFESLSAFHAAIIDHWASRTTRPLIASLAPADDPQEALRNLLLTTLRSGEALERAMRSWATVSKDVAHAVEKVDAERIAYAETLLNDCGVPPIEATARAKLLYWAAIGRLMMPFPDQSQLSDDDIEKIAGLMAGA